MPSSTFSIVSGPSNGTLGAISNNTCSGPPNADTASVTYTPNANFSGSDLFTYKVNDGTLDSNVATVSITVNGIDDPPTAVNDSATVTEDSGANAINVLANDTDPDGGPKTIQTVTQPANGSVSVTGGGSGLTYTPNANYCNGGSPVDSFTYTLNGGSTATVSVTVTCVDDPPTAVNDSATVTEDSGANAINVLANDTDPDGGPKTIQTVTQPANGSVSVTGGGSGLTYTPNANYCNGGSPVDSFTYTLNGGSTATVSVTVTCVDDPPTAVNDSATVTEDSGANAINVLANDTDPDGGPKTIQTVTQPANGSVSVTGAGSRLTYTPNAKKLLQRRLARSTAPRTDGGPKTIQTVTQPANAIVCRGRREPHDPDRHAARKRSVSVTGGESGLTYTPNANYCNGGSPVDSFTYTLNGGSTCHRFSDRDLRRRSAHGSQRLGDRHRGLGRERDQRARERHRPRRRAEDDPDRHAARKRERVCHRRRERLDVHPQRQLLQRRLARRQLHVHAQRRLPPPPFQ